MTRHNSWWGERSSSFDLNKWGVATAKLWDDDIIKLPAPHRVSRLHQVHNDWMCRLMINANMPLGSSEQPEPCHSHCMDMTSSFTSSQTLLPHVLWAHNALVARDRQDGDIYFRGVFECHHNINIVSSQYTNIVVRSTTPIRWTMAFVPSQSANVSSPAHHVIFTWQWTGRYFCYLRILRDDTRWFYEQTMRCSARISKWFIKRLSSSTTTNLAGFS